MNILMLRVPVYGKNVSPVPSSGTRTIYTRQDRSIISYSLRENRGHTIEFSLKKSRLIRPGNVFIIFKCLMLVTLTESCPLFLVLFWQLRMPLRSPGAASHLFQGPTCCAYWNALVYTIVVKIVYSSYCCLSISLNQRGHSPPIFFINMVSAHWNIFFLSYK